MSEPFKDVDVVTSLGVDCDCNQFRSIESCVLECPEDAPGELTIDFIVDGDMNDSIEEA